eukprot:2725844-Rhodomonas_salina.1
MSAALSLAVSTAEPGSIVCACQSRASPRDVRTQNVPETSPRAGIQRKKARKHTPSAAGTCW